MDESVDDAAAQLRLWISAPEKAQYDGLTEEEARILDVVKEATGGSPLHQLLLAGECARASLLDEARRFLNLVVEGAKRPREALLRLNALFSLGALLYDAPASLTIGVVDPVGTGLECMREVAETGPNVVVEPEDVRVLPASELVASARYNIGRAYFEGVGVATSDAEAVRWWKLAASDGDPRGCSQAQHALGHFFSLSRRVDPLDPLKMTKPNWDESFSWHMAAAKNGNCDSMLAVGLAHREGKGVQQSNAEALQWIKLAVEGGCQAAEPILCVHYYDMRLYRKCLEWASSAHEVCQEITPVEKESLSDQYAHWLASACWHGGRCHEKGLAVTKNIDEARQWYKLATMVRQATVATLMKQAGQGLC